MHASIQLLSCDSCLLQVDDSTLALHLWPPGSVETRLPAPTSDPQQVQPSAAAQDGAGVSQAAAAAAGLMGTGPCTEAASREEQRHEQQRTSAERKQHGSLAASPLASAFSTKAISPSPEELVWGCCKRRRQSATRKAAVAAAPAAAAGPAEAAGVATSRVALSPHLQPHSGTLQYETTRIEHTHWRSPRRAAAAERAAGASAAAAQAGKGKAAGAPAVAAEAEAAGGLSEAVEREGRVGGQGGPAAAGMGPFAAGENEDVAARGEQEAPAAAGGGMLTFGGDEDAPHGPGMAGVYGGIAVPLGAQPEAATETDRGRDPGAHTDLSAAAGGKRGEGGRIAIAAAGEGSTGVTVAAAVNGFRSSAAMLGDDSMHANASTGCKRVSMEEAAKWGQVALNPEKVKVESELPPAAAAAATAATAAAAPQVVVPLLSASRKQAAAGKLSITWRVGNGKEGRVTGFEGLLADKAESPGSPFAVVASSPADLRCSDPLAQGLAAAALKAGLLGLSGVVGTAAAAVAAAGAGAAAAGGLGSGRGEVKGWGGDRRARGSASAETPSPANEGVRAQEDGVPAAAADRTLTPRAHKASAEGRGSADAWTMSSAARSGGHTAAATKPCKGPGAAVGAEGGFAGGPGGKEMAELAGKGRGTTAAAGGMLVAVASAKKRRVAVAVPLPAVDLRAAELGGSKPASTDAVAKGEQLMKVKVEPQPPAVAASSAVVSVAAAITSGKLGRSSATAAAGNVGSPSCHSKQAAKQVEPSNEQLGGCPFGGQGKVGSMEVAPSKLQGVGGFSKDGGVSRPAGSRGAEVGVCKQEPLPMSTPSALQPTVAGSRSRKQAALGTARATGAAAAGVLPRAGEQEGRGGGGQGQSTTAAAGKGVPVVQETERVSAREEQVQSAAAGYQRQEACLPVVGNRGAARPGEQPAAAPGAGKGRVAGTEALRQANNMANPSEEGHGAAAAAAGVLMGVAAAAVHKKRRRAADVPMQVNASGTGRDLGVAGMDRGAKGEQLLMVKVESELPVLSATPALRSGVAPAAAAIANITSAKLQKLPAAAAATAEASAGAPHTITEKGAMQVGAIIGQRGNCPIGGQGRVGASSKLQGVADLSKDAWISLPVVSGGWGWGGASRSSHQHQCHLHNSK